MKNKKGFVHPEILIVILIIAIVGVVVFALRNSSQSIIFKSPPVPTLEIVNNLDKSDAVLLFSMFKDLNTQTNTETQKLAYYDPSQEKIISIGNIETLPSIYEVSYHCGNLFYQTYVDRSHPSPAVYKLNLENDTLTTALKPSGTISSSRRFISTISQKDSMTILECDYYHEEGTILSNTKNCNIQLHGGFFCSENPSIKTIDLTNDTYNGYTTKFIDVFDPKEQIALLSDYEPSDIFEEGLYSKYLSISFKNGEVKSISAEEHKKLFDDFSNAGGRDENKLCIDKYINGSMFKNLMNEYKGGDYYPLPRYIGCISREELTKYFLN